MRCQIRIRKTFYLIADPDPESGIQINADPDTNPGQTLLSLKVEFYMKNYFKEVIGHKTYLRKCKSLFERLEIRFVSEF
jgi:hypothetical protein